MKVHTLFALLFFAIVSHGQGDSLHIILDAENQRVIESAKKYFNSKPVTVTSAKCGRSAGGIHDFYSEGDYWWPDPENSKNPYIRRDGITNPDNFTAHREAMIRFSQISGALASAYLVTGEDKYVSQLIPHLRAWFVDKATLMNPNLLYGQAIMGRVTGRGIGIIDTIHLLEVAKAVKAIESSGVPTKVEINKIKDWFATYLDWITTHPYGIAERDNGNNHSVCWALQVAVFAELVGNRQQSDFAKNFYKTELLPNQMAVDGSFPLEIERTKPYGYSLFTLDAMTALCQVLSNQGENLFVYTTEDGKNIGKGIEFLYPYTKDKSSWPFKKDVMYWEKWPVRHPYLLFGGLKLNKPKYVNLWSTLDADFDTPEILRNMPIRFPMLWIKR